MKQRQKISLNQAWQFRFGDDFIEPRHLTMKSLSLGGLTTPIKGEPGQRMVLGPSGGHFLGLVGQGNQDRGLQIVAGTDTTSELDDAWRTVTLPHDWKREQPYDNDPRLTMNGFKADGVAYYRKSFAVNQTALGQQLILHFDGIMGMADIWYNGAFLKHNESGYVTIDIDVTALTSYGDEGNNTLLIKTDTRHGAEGWWSEGAGIYRDVWLEIMPAVHLSAPDSYLTTLSEKDGTAKIKAVVMIINDSDAATVVTPTVSVAGQTISLARTMLDAHTQKTVEQEFMLHDYDLWSPEKPTIYQAIFKAGNDEVVKNFGIKTVEYRLDGFYLNHQRYELHGVCYHQDFAGVGIAQTKGIINYKVQLLKAAGVNALRSAHHCASPDLLDACDRYGILLMNENRLLETSPWRLADLKRMVKLSRMHPCLAFWSLSNEELVGNTKMGGRLNKQVAALIRQLDQEHLLVQAELLNTEGIVDDDYISHIDVLGVNYPESMVMSAGAQIIHDKHPQLPMMCTENACAFTTRGAYRDDFDHGQFNNFGAMYSMVFPGKGKPGDPGLGGTAMPERVLQYVKEHPYMGGCFIWTGFDYYGEPSPLAWPSVASSYGIMDLCGFKKDYYYYYQAHWTVTPVLHLLPSWNAEQLEIAADGTTPVRVYTNADEVQIWVNNHNYGKHSVKDCTVNLRVPFVAGTLKAEAFKNGQSMGTVTQTTTTAATHLTTKCLIADDQIQLYEVQAVDDQNHFVNNAQNTVEVTVNNGEIWALSNGDVFNHDEKHLRLFNGRGLIIVRPQGKANIQTILC